jgi:hypothetical protein
MNKQQTSVEWLENRIKVLIPKDIGSQLMFKSNIAKAKVLEKQQIIDAYEKGDKYKLEISGEQHYNETFNK